MGPQECPHPQAPSTHQRLCLSPDSGPGRGGREVLRWGLRQAWRSCILQWAIWGAGDSEWREASRGEPAHTPNPSTEPHPLPIPPSAHLPATRPHLLNPVASEASVTRAPGLAQCGRLIRVCCGSEPSWVSGSPWRWGAGAEGKGGAPPTCILLPGPSTAFPRTRLSPAPRRGERRDSWQKSGVTASSQPAWVNPFLTCASVPPFVE